MKSTGNSSLFRFSLSLRAFLLLFLFLLSFFSFSFSSVLSLSTTTSSSFTLDFSTFIGSSGDDSGSSIAVDSQGNIFVAGSTQSSNFPTKNAFNSTYGGGADVFVAKFTSTGNLVFSTFLGGSYDDFGSGIAVDTQGNIYVTGSTFSSNFPTKNAYNATFGGASQDDVFVAKFNSTGSLVFSTFLGGSSSDAAYGIAVDTQDNCYITGTTLSSNFPTKNAYNATFGGSDDVFVAKFNASGNLVFSTFLGGSDGDFGYGIAVDDQSNIYVTGSTSSSNFPTVNTHNLIYFGSNDVFVAKFNSTGNLVFSTFLGGTLSDTGYGIAVDNQDNIYVTGVTSSANFPIMNTNYVAFGGYQSAFVTKFNTSGNLVFSSFLAGSASDSGYSIAVDGQGNIYVTGSTYSSDFPIKNAYNSTFGGGGDVFVTKFNTSGILVFSSFLGSSGTDSGSSIAVDNQDNIYVTGVTSSANFPILNAYYATFGGYQDVFVTKFSPLTFTPSSNSHLPFISSLFSFIFSSNLIYFVILTGIIVIILGIVILIEFRNYSARKRKSSSKISPSFYKYLMNKLHFHRHESSVPTHLSDKTFELLDAIEQENNPKD